MDGALADRNAGRDPPLRAGDDPGRSFDRLPDSLRICFAHGGGSFAFWLGRLENAWHRRGDLIAKSQLPPSAYVGRFSVDSVVFEPSALRLLVDTLARRR